MYTKSRWPARPRFLDRRPPECHERQARVEPIRSYRHGPWALLLLVALPARADEPAQRVHADAFVTWIYPRADFDRPPIGYLRAGTAVLTRSEPKIRGAGCPGGFQAIEPAGYVCLGRSASESETRYGRNLTALAPKSGPFPFHFALSMGSPAYRRLPTESEVRRQETKFGRAVVRPLPPHWQGHEELVGGDHLADGVTPSFLHDGGSVSRWPEDRLVRREIPFGSMIAVHSAFSHDGRKYLVSADGTVVPAERFVPFRRSEFAGVPLEGELTLPLAWTRREVQLAENSCAKTNEQPPRSGRLEAPSPLSPSCLTTQAGGAERTLAPRSLVRLSGRRRSVGRALVVETTGGHWLRQADLYLAERPEETVSRQDKWIHFSIGRGTLLAFEGEKPVFATLASPGMGGRPLSGGDPLADRTTPLGTFRVQFKHWTDDMSPEQSEHRSFFIADVPYAQFFQPPFAIHVAYWHESFGEPMSGGCINVSPRDGERLFGWTDPPLPNGWHGVGAGPQFGPGTWVKVSSD